MPVLLLSSAPYAHGEEVANEWCKASRYRQHLTDDLLNLTEKAYGFSKAKLGRALSGSPSVFNAFTHEKEKAVAYLRGGFARLLEEDQFVFCGDASLLVPRAVTFALKVCLVAPHDYRVQQAARLLGLSPNAAAKDVDREDAQQASWTQYLFGLSPWDPGLYDILLPMHQTTVEQATEIIRENIGKPALARTSETEASLQDFQLAAKAGILLANKGHDAEVACENGYATVIINQYTVLMERLEGELKALVSSVEGVKGATTRVGPRFRQPGIYLDFDAESPSKVLLVDDEKEYVQTLSERLLTRNVGTAVAYSGEEALAIIEDDEPEVVVLDLQMPGIDGIEVLRRVKKGHPDTQVIILTGHGSEREEKIAHELGAFAYLNKPVDINVLSKTMKDAYRRIADSRIARGDGQ
jgi:two-component system, OmpR family, response regulator CpxR